MSTHVTPEGLEYEVWMRMFIVLPSGEIKRFSKSRFNRIHHESFTGQKAIQKGDPFRDEELIKDGRKRYARTALLILSSLPKQVEHSEWSDYEITPAGLIKADLWARTFGRPWAPTKEQYDYMLADALNKKTRRPSIKHTPEDERFEFN